MLNNIKITDITKTKKGFNALFTREGFLVSVDDTILSKYNIEIGSCLTRQELACIVSSSQNQRAVDKCFSFLSYRMHSRKELYDKLIKFYDADTCEYAVNKMQELGYLDDEKFAFAKADYLINTKKNSVSAARMKLLSLGIDKDIADSVLLFFDTGNQTETVLGLIQTKYRFRLTQPEKVIASLLRKGFRLSEIRRAMSMIDIDIQE